MVRFLEKLKLFGKKLLFYHHRFNTYNPRIRHDFKCIFVHIPKTAGSSITKSLESLPGNNNANSPRISKHAKAFEIKGLLGDEIWEEYFTFAFMRNPWDLMVSSYHWWLQKAGKIPYHHRHHRRISMMEGFNDFIYSRYGQKMINERYGELRDWVTEKDNILVDFLGKVETLDDDWKKICIEIGIEPTALARINTSNREEYRKYYTPETRRIIAKRFEWVINKFNYSF
jgi:hypothetical protein